MEDFDTYGYDPELDQEDQEVTDETDQSGLSAVSAPSGLRAELVQRLLDREKKASEVEQQDFNTVLNTIEQAKQRLLAQPSKGEELRNIAMRLTQPRKESDPRFYERRNLYTFLRDIGEYGGEQAEARKEAEAKALELDQLTAKYRMDRAQKEGSQARQLLAQYLSKEPTTRDSRTTDAKNAADMGMTLEEYYEFKASLAKKPDDGKLTIPEVRSIRVEVASTLSDPKKMLKVANDGLSNLNLAVKGNTQAEAQLNRSLATLSGDKALSIAEVETVVGAGSFAQRVGNAISKFFTGGAGELTNQEKKELLETYEAYYAQQYNNSREDLKEIYSEFEGLPESIFGRPYVSVADKRRRKAEEEARQKADQEKSEPAGITLSTQKTVRPVD